MIHTSSSSFFAEIKKNASILGLDVGTKHIGVAISDITRTVATPFVTISKKKFSEKIEVLKNIVDENNIAGIVVGLPLNMNGSKSKMSQSVMQFSKNVSKEIPLPILMWDERLSTVAVEKSMIEGDLSRRRRRELIDKSAASYILQGVLDGI